MTVRARGDGLRDRPNVDRDQLDAEQVGRVLIEDDVAVAGDDSTEQAETGTPQRSRGSGPANGCSDRTGVARRRAHRPVWTTFPAKDVRQWVKEGANRDDIISAVKESPIRKKLLIMHSWKRHRTYRGPYKPTTVRTGGL